MEQFGRFYQRWNGCFKSLKNSKSNTIAIAAILTSIWRLISTLPGRSLMNTTPSLMTRQHPRCHLPPSSVQNSLGQETLGRQARVDREGHYCCWTALDIWIQKCAFTWSSWRGKWIWRAYSTTGTEEFMDWDLPTDDEVSTDEEDDEFNSWQVIKCDKKVINPIKYWKENQDSWHRLARMAFDMFGIPAMSTDVEWTFSDDGDMITKKHNRLHADTVSACLCLKQWIRMRQLNGHSHRSLAKVSSRPKVSGYTPKIWRVDPKLRVIENIFHHNAQDRIAIQKWPNIFVFQT